MVCPRCLTPKKLGSGGVRAVLKRHYGTDKCNAAREALKRPTKKIVDKKEQSTLQSFKSFWGPKKSSAVPSTVTKPGLIFSKSSPGSAPIVVNDQSHAESSTQTTQHTKSVPAASTLGYRNILNDIADRLASPNEDTINDFLAVFEHPPSIHDPDVNVPIEEVWEESLNALFHQAFKWGATTDEYRKLVGGLTPQRLKGLVRFIEYFVDIRGLGEGVIEARVLRLIEEINKWCVQALYLKATY